MDTFFSRYKNPLVLAMVLVAQFFLLAVQVRRPFPAATAKVDQEGVRAIRLGVTTVVTPPESVLHKSGLSVRSVWSSYLDLIGVREQNLQLKEEIDQLRLEQASLAEDARQGERLQDMLAFRQHYINATVPAQVVGTSGTDRSRVLYLDKGSDDGIAVDMPVITPDGIVGRIREVYPHAAQVLEISDPTSASGVLLEETRTRGILRGNAQGQPQIVNLMPDDRIKPGQVVLTSGGDQIFPRGLPVGIVDHIAPDLENEPMVNVVLKPAANLGRLEEVLVVTGTGPAPTDRARKSLSKSELIAAGVRAAKEQNTASVVSTQIAEVQRASEVLAERLPSRKDAIDPYAPDASPDSSPATSEAQAKPLHPPSALHADHYTPGSAPSAESLTPGQRYTPLVEGTAATERRPAKAGDTSVNATDNAPIGTDSAFSGASAAMAAERKAKADARVAAAARQYAIEHPGSAPAAAKSDETPDVGTAAAGTLPPMHYVERTNADGTVTRVAVPAPKPVLYTKRVNEDGTVSWVPASTAATASGAVQYTNRTNADGTVTRVPVPTLYIARVNADGTIAHVPAPAPTGALPSIHYVNRTNADGTVTRVAVPATGVSTPAVTYMNRTNADGTITRVAVPAASPSGAKPAVHYVTITNADGTTTRITVPGSAPAVTYVNRTNADGTVTRVAMSSANTTNTAGSTPTVRYTTRTNADGTVTRVPIPAAAVGSATGSPPAVHYTTRTNADGTVTRVPVPASTTASGSTAGSKPVVRYTTRTNADGTVTRVPVAPGSGATAASTQPRPATSPGAVTTRVITDGPLPSGSRTSSAVKTASTPGTPGNVVKPGTAPAQTGAGTAAAPRRKAAPALVPDDGRRPPAAPTPKPGTPAPQEQH